MTRGPMMKRSSLIALLTLVITLGACAQFQSTMEYDRHRMSQLRVDEGDDSLYIFEAQTDANYPANTPEGDAARMEWITVWLRNKKACPYGFEIVERRPIPKSEMNVYRYELRYWLKCKPQPPEE